MWHDTYFTRWAGQDVRVDHIMTMPETGESHFWITWPDGSEVRVDVMGVYEKNGPPVNDRWVEWDNGYPGFASDEGHNRSAARFYGHLLRRLIDRAHDEISDEDRSTFSVTVGEDGGVQIELASPILDADEDNDEEV